MSYEPYYPNIHDEEGIPYTDQFPKDSDKKSPPTEGEAQPEWAGVEVEEEVYKPTETNITETTEDGEKPVKILSTSDEPITFGITNVCTNSQEIKDVNKIKFVTGKDSNVIFTLEEVMEQMPIGGGVRNVKTAIVYVDVYYA